VLAAASEQIMLALRESQPQVEALGEALGQLAAALAQRGGPAAGDVATLGSDLRHAVTRLQFYDRMTQHLTHVQDYLSRSALQIDHPSPPAGGWDSVHQQLADRLLTETQRFHLGKNFLEEQAASAEARERKSRGPAAPGDIDLF
jgi:predicted trehalose synthase